MSFAEKIGALMQRPNDDLVSKDEIPWWLKYSARGIGSVGGAFALFFGVFYGILSVVTISFSGILAGVFLSLLAFTVLIAEAPCCCLFVDYVQEASNWVEKRPYWNRAVYYMLASFLTLTMEFGLARFLSCGLIFITGLLYGMMALGKKASTEEMRNNAATVYATNKQQFPPAAASNANLVEGVQPVSFSNPFDSRV